MKKNFETPLMTVSMFAAENVVTSPSGDVTESNAYKTTINKIVGKDKLVSDTAHVFTFTF